VLCLALANYHLSDYETSLAQAKEAVRIARELGPAGRWELGEALFYYAVRLFLHPQGAYDEQAFAAAEEHLRISQTGDRWDVGGYWLLGYIQTFRGQMEEARQSFENALRIFSELDEYGSIRFSLFNLAMHHRQAGQYALSQQYCQKLFVHAHTMANLEGYDLFLYETGMLLAYRLREHFSKNEAQAGQDAVKLLSFVSKMTDEYRQFGWYGRFKTRELQAVGLLRDHLGEQVYTRAWGEGQALSLEEALALALTLQHQAESMIIDQGTIQSS